MATISYRNNGDIVMNPFTNKFEKVGQVAVVSTAFGSVELPLKYYNSVQTSEQYIDSHNVAFVMGIKDTVEAFCFVVKKGGEVKRFDAIYKMAAYVFGSVHAEIKGRRTYELRMCTEISRKEIFKYAHALKKQGYGITFAECLKMAWAFAKAQTQGEAIVSKNESLNDKVVRILPLLKMKFGKANYWKASGNESICRLYLDNGCWIDLKTGEINATSRIAIEIGREVMAFIKDCK